MDKKKDRHQAVNSVYKEVYGKGKPETYVPAIEIDVKGKVCSGKSTICEFIKKL